MNRIGNMVINILRINKLSKTKLDIKYKYNINNKFYYI